MKHLHQGTMLLGCLSFVLQATISNCKKQYRHATLRKRVSGLPLRHTRFPYALLQDFFGTGVRLTCFAITQHVGHQALQRHFVNVHGASEHMGCCCKLLLYRHCDCRGDVTAANWCLRSVCVALQASRLQGWWQQLLQQLPCGSWCWEEGLSLLAWLCRHCDCGIGCSNCHGSCHLAPGKAQKEWQMEHIHAHAAPLQQATACQTVKPGSSQPDRQHTPAAQGRPHSKRCPWRRHPTDVINNSCSERGQPCPAV